MKKLKFNEYDDLPSFRKSRKTKRLRAALKTKDVDALENYDEEWY